MRITSCIFRNDSRFFSVVDNEREGYVLVKAKAEKLIQHLIEDRDKTMDPHYDEDFLLMYRVFLDGATHVFHQFLQWFEDPAKRDKVRLDI